MRQIADVLRRHGALEDADYQRIQTIGRDMSLLDVAERWYRSGVHRHSVAAIGLPHHGISTEAHENPDEAFDQVLALAMRPWLSRCAEVLQQRTELALWTHSHCALCGSEPDFAVITPAAERHLICGRCALRWKFEPLTCPYCRNSDRIAHHVVRDTRRAVPRLRVRRVPPLSEGVRRAARDAAGDAGGGWRRDAAARRGRDAARLLVAKCEVRSAKLKVDVTSNFGLRPSVGRGKNRRYLDRGSAARPVPNQSCAFVEIQLNRWRVSQKRPAFDFAPSTTTATSGPPCGKPQQRREAIARLADEAGLARLHVDVALHHELIGAVNRDLMASRVDGVVRRPHDARDALVA